VDFDALRDDLVRAVFPTAALTPITMRAAAEDGADAGDVTAQQRTLTGHFAVFNAWTEIDSYWEGNFLERLAPGCFAKTMAEQRDAIKVLYDHGYDPQLGNKPLGPIDVLEEDKVGARYEVPLIDTDYNRDFIIPAVDAGLLGASFRFRVVKDEVNQDPGTSDYNPKGLPERTIREVRLFEFGPVTFGAYLAATAGLRSRGDVELWQRLDEAGRAELAGLLARHQICTPADPAARGADVEPGAASSTVEPPQGTRRVTPHARRARLLSLGDAL
jgi:HK97 family phage prohead protease